MTLPPAAAFAAEPPPPFDQPLDVRALEAQYAAATADAESLAAALTDEQARWRPRPGAWSVAECLAHLAVLNRTYLDPFARAAVGARAAGRTGRGPWRLSWFGRAFTRAMGPVTGRGLGRKLPAPAAYAPPSDVALADALADFRDVQGALVDRLRASDGVDLSAVLVRSPAWPALRFSLLTAYAALAAHERRHLAQARRVTARPGFPGA
jgi:hypothetical protein